MGRGNLVGPGVVPLEVHRRRARGEGLRLRVRVRGCHGGGVFIYRAAADPVLGFFFGVVLRAADSGGAGGARHWAVGDGGGLG